MDTIVKKEEIEDHIKKIDSFISSNSDIILKIRNKASDVQGRSLELLDVTKRSIISLALANIQFIIKNSYAKVGNISDSISERMTLIAVFLQGYETTETAILSAQYIKAAAILKQDYETIIRIRQIKSGKAQYGKNPNAKFAPDGTGFLNGQLNDIAHISKINVLEFYLGREVREGLGISPIPVIKEEQLNSFYLYFLVICVEISQEAVAWYKDTYGMDSTYKEARIYSRIISQKVREIKESVSKKNNA